MTRFALAITAFLLSACATHAAEPAESAGAGAMKMHHEPHVMRHESAADFETTLAQLKGAVEARGFKTFAVIDHAAGAASVDQPLRPTTLIVFGNPQGGTPVMQAEQLMGLELPLKMLVMEKPDGGVALVWRDMAHSLHEYGIDGHPAADKMSAALEAIAQEAGQGD